MIQLVRTETKEDLKVLKRLYLTAFPKAERKPFSMMVKKQEKGVMEIFSLKDEHDTFLGLAIFALDEDLALLDYFAIADEFRGQGVGSQAMQLLKNHCPERRFFLEIETTLKPSKDREIRCRRKSFYLRNGLKEIPFYVNLFGVEMEILGTCETLSYTEYHRLYEKTCGPLFSRRIHQVI